MVKRGTQFTTTW